MTQQITAFEEEKTSLEDKLAGLKVETKELKKKAKRNEVCQILAMQHTLTH